MWKNLAPYALLTRVWDVTRLWKEYEDSSKACVCVCRVCVFGLCIVCVLCVCVCVCDYHMAYNSTWFITKRNESKDQNGQIYKHVHDNFIHNNWDMFSVCLSVNAVFGCQPDYIQN